MEQPNAKSMLISLIMAQQVRRAAAERGAGGGVRRDAMMAGMPRSHVSERAVSLHFCAGCVD
eukprot:COSAG01_NODE_71924_length_254_cov_0.993548_1_plen_62_part_00